MGQRQREQGSYTGKKADWFLQGYFPLKNKGVYQADYLTSTNQVLSD